MRKRKRCDSSTQVDAATDLRKNLDKVGERSKKTKQVFPAESSHRAVSTRDKYLLSFLWWLSPTKHENEVLLSLYQQCLACLQAVDPAVKLNIFGSFMYGVGTPSSDLDMNVTTSHPKLRSVRGIGAVLQRTHAFYDIKTIRNAKVPIVKCKHRHTGVSLDFTLNNDSGERTGLCAKRILDKYPASRLIVVFTKYILRIKGLMDVSQGGISSFALCLLAVSYLKNAPRSCGFVELLTGFLYHYGYTFMPASMGVDIHRTSPATKPGDICASMLYVLDPTDTKNNVTKACRVFLQVQQEFRAMHRSFRSFLRDKECLSLRILRYFALPDAHFMRKREEVNRYHPGLVDFTLRKHIDEQNVVSYLCSQKVVKRCSLLSSKIFVHRNLDMSHKRKQKRSSKAVAV